MYPFIELVAMLIFVLLEHLPMLGALPRRPQEDFPDVRERQRKLQPVVPTGKLWRLEDWELLKGICKAISAPQYCHFDLYISKKTCNIFKYIEKILP